MKKRLLSLVLSASILGSLVHSNTTYANSNNSSSSVGSKKNVQTFTNRDTVYVEEDGETIAVQVIEEIQVENPSKGYRPMDFSPKHRVGETRNYSFKISNSDLGLPSFSISVLSSAARTKAAKIVAKAIAKRLGASFLPGINIVSTILSGIAWVNDRTGKNGIELKVSLKYTERYYRRDGYYIYGWNITKVSLGRY